MQLPAGVKQHNFDGQPIQYCLDKGLSPQEVLVKQGILNGLHAKEIASSLNITVATVKWHKTNIFNKMKVKSSKQLLFKELEYYKQLSTTKTVKSY